MRLSLVSLLILLTALLTQAQTGPCTESTIKQGNLPTADDAFSFMPPYGKPVVGTAATKAANAKSFSGRTNITRSWVGEHKIVSTPLGDMAYEYGTMHMGYDSKEEGGHQEFEAVLLIVYKANKGVCQEVALTMQPLEEDAKH